MIGLWNSIKIWWSMLVRDILSKCRHQLTCRSPGSMLHYQQGWPDHHGSMTTVTHHTSRLPTLSCFPSWKKNKANSVLGNYPGCLLVCCSSHPSTTCTVMFVLRSPCKRHVCLASAAAWCWAEAQTLLPPLMPCKQDVHCCHGQSAVVCDISVI